MEHSSIDYFIKSFAGEDRFSVLCSNLMKDIELLNSEIDRVKTATRRDIENEHEREEAFQRQLDRVQKQIHTTTIEQADPNKIIQLQKTESSTTRTRDVFLGLTAACLIAGVVLTLVLNNTVLLSILLGMIPGLGGAILFQSRVHAARAAVQDLQRQTYAYNIAQRGIF